MALLAKAAMFDQLAKEQQKPLYNRPPRHLSNTSQRKYTQTNHQGIAFNGIFAKPSSTFKPPPSASTTTATLPTPTPTSSSPTPTPASSSTPPSSASSSSSSSSSSPSTLKIHSFLSDVTTEILLLLGMTGGGKSSIFNAIFGGDLVSRESGRLKACTDDIVIAEGDWFGIPGNGRVTVVDTPGFLDSEGRDVKHLQEIVDFFSNFPRNKLCGVLVTLPLTESRTKSTYGDIMSQIDLLVGEETFDHCIFVTTMQNQLNPKLGDLIESRKEDWKNWLSRSCFIENPTMCNFMYGDPSSLSLIREKFMAATPFTPETSQQIDALFKNHPGQSVADAIKHVEVINQMKEDMLRELENQKSEVYRLEKGIVAQEEISARQEAQLAQYQQSNQNLQAQVTNLQNNPVIVRVNRGGGGKRGRCVIS